MVADVTVQTWDDMTPTIPATCSYRVTAYNTLNEESAQTNPVSKTFAVSGEVPGPVTATFTWQLAGVTPPPGPDVTSYVATYSNVDGSTAADHAVTSVAVQAGDAIFVFSKWEDTTGITVSVTDNASGGSNTYTNRTDEQSASGPCVEMTTAIAKASETLTITSGTGSSVPWRRTWVIVARPTSGYEFVYDNGQDGTGTSPNYTTGSYTVSGGAGFAVVGVGEYASTTYTPGSGWIETLDSNSCFAAYQILTTETSIAGTATGTTMQFAAASVAMKEQATGGGGGVVRTTPTNIRQAVARASLH